MKKFTYNDKEHKERLDIYIKRFEQVNQFIFKNDDQTKFYEYFEKLYFTMCYKYYEDNLNPNSKVVMRNEIDRQETEQYIKDVFEQKYKERIDEEIVLLEEINQHHLKKIEELLNENKKLKKIIEGFGNS